MVFTKWVPSMMFLQVKSQVSKGPEKVQKGRNAKLLDRCTSTLYGLYVKKKESVKTVKGGRSYGVHKVGTVDDILQVKSPSFKRSRKGPERQKCKTFGSVHIYIIWAIC